MEIKAAELPLFKDKKVVVQEDLTGRSQDEDYREVEGRVIEATVKGLVVQTRTGVVIIMTQHILDVEEVKKNPTKRLVKRWIRESTLESVKQHLLDRHGWPFDLVSEKAMPTDMLLHRHDLIDHSNLGHGHGDKPASTRGRKPKADVVPGQRVDEPDEMIDDEEMSDE